MKSTAKLLLLLLFSWSISSAKAQIDQDKLGAWYMYFWSLNLNESQFGFQGDLQYRNWNLGGDMEQLMLRGGPTWRLKDKGAKFTLGAAFIRTEQFGSSIQGVNETRFYQEALIPNNLLEGRVRLTHRFRYEQRLVENQDFRTRYRYMISANFLFNGKSYESGVWYLALYNELFINGERNIGSGRRVEVFDRNRAYGAIGYTIKPNLRTQVGVMRQITDSWMKNQLQISLHHTISVKSAAPELPE